MAAGMDFSPPFTVIEDGYGKDNLSGMEDDKNSENLDNLKQITNGKPPRHVSVLRHCVGTTRLLAATDLVSSSSIICLSVLWSCFIESSRCV